jgi:hypothetical protein
VKFKYKIKGELIMYYAFKNVGKIILNCNWSEGRQFKSQMRWVFLIYLILPAALWPRVNSASNKNEYQESSWGKKVAGV